MTQTDRQLRSQEYRLGLVMYGGVSLAIYIFGVAQEFFNAVRGRGVYRLIKALTDSDIVVDIISGTSAGGINGILLSYALTNEREFSACNAIWRDAGDIGTLLHDTGSPPDQVRSVLKSEYYQEQLEQCLAGMPAISPSISEDPSWLQELDLFITGTDVAGTVYTWFDDHGHPVDVKNHRTIFLLKHRAKRKTPFAPGCDPDVTHKALAKLARITSCFPVAFQPVEVKNVAPQNDGPVDSRLQQWGRMGKEKYFLDGGILDNKPFTYTLREIFYRLADRKVDRKLFYVEPDPERFADTDPSHSEPSVLQAALKSLIAIPSYESISEDLKMLSAHNEKVRRYERLERLHVPVEQELTSATRAFLKRIRNPGAEETPDEKLCLYAHTRLMELSERVVRGVLREHGHDVRIDPKQRDTAKNLFQAFDQGLGNSEKTLQDFDIYFRLRRMFDVLYRIPPPPPGDSKQSARLRTKQARIGRQIKLLEVLASAMERLVDEAEVPWIDRSSEDVWQTVQTAFQRLLHTDGLLPENYQTSWSNGDPGKNWLNQKTLDIINEKLKSRTHIICEELSRSGTLAPLPIFDSPLSATDECERQMLRILECKLKRWYDDFLVLDAHFLPLKVFAELGERDFINTVRISPFDADLGFSNRPGSQKISGDLLHHFGGFFKRSWRSNDILWGRLDGLCQLVEALFTRKRLQQVGKNDGLRVQMQKRLANDLSPDTLFPRSTPEVRQRLSAWLTMLFSDTESERNDALEGEFDDRLSLLVEAAQLEILGQDLPEVIKDAVQQQAEWNQYRFRPQYMETVPQGSIATRWASKLLFFKPKRKKHSQPELEGGFDMGTDAFYITGPGKLDPLVIAAASERLAQRTSETITDLAGFFRDSKNYRVGEESIKTGIPPLVLMQTLTQTLIATRNAIITTAGDQADKLRSHPANRWLGFFLYVLHGLARFMRTTPGGVKLTFFVISLVSVLLLIVGITWWKEIIHPTAGVFYIRWFVVLVLLPALALTVQAVWLWRRAAGGLLRLTLVLTPLAALIWWRESFPALLCKLFGC